MNNNTLSEIITSEDLSAAYKSKVIWEHANISVKKGEFIGLLGPNGAGKTTMFRLLLGLSKPSSGTLKIFNEEPKKGNIRIGYVPQRRFIDTENKIESLEYVRLGISGTRFGFNLPKHASKERKMALDTLTSIDALNLAYRPLSELSGGEMQRIFLAQALIGKPDLLLLDEPLANLDIRRESELIRLVNNVVKHQNVAVLLIAHDINPLLPFVDRIIYIANGRVASGTPGEIVTSKRLTALYNAPIEVLKGSKGQLAVLGIEEAVHNHG